MYSEFDVDFFPNAFLYVPYFEFDDDFYPITFSVPLELYSEFDDDFYRSTFLYVFLDF